MKQKINILKRFFNLNSNSVDNTDILNAHFDIGNGKANYLLNISKRHQFLYVETPKVACSSVKKTLQKIELKGKGISIPDKVHDKKTSPLLSPSDLKSKELLEVLHSKKYFRFSFVRNPYTRIVSSFLEKVDTEHLGNRTYFRNNLGFGLKEKVSFTDFLKVISKQKINQMDIHWCPQTNLLGFEKMTYSFIGRFENFGNDLEYVAIKILKDEAINTSQFLETARRHSVNANSRLNNFITDEAIKYIQKIYADDFKHFNYSTNPNEISTIK